MQNSKSLPLLVSCLIFSLLLSACKGNPTTQGLELTMLCRDGKPRTSGARGVSFVFKAKTNDGRPVTDLEVSDWFDIGDENNTTVLRPQNVALRTLILLDGSESLLAQESTIKAAVELFITLSLDETAPQEAREIALYKFYGDNEIVRIHDFSSDSASLIAALRADSYVRAGAGTSLYDATRLAIEELTLSPSYEPGEVRPALLGRSLVVFTDGRDDVYSGEAALRAREAALATAMEFQNNGANSILVAGIDRRDGSLDESFLNEVASANGFIKESDPLLLNGLFSDLADMAGEETRKYYQFNFCSNHRGQIVNAELIVSPATTYRQARLPFEYDATEFDDGACDAESLPTCEWNDGPTLPEPTPTPTPTPTPQSPAFGRQIGAIGIDSVEEVASDASGDTFVLGLFDHTVDFGGVSLINANPAHNYFSVGHYLAKYNRASGGLDWAVKLPGEGPIDQGKTMTLDSDGNVIVAAGNFVEGTAGSSISVIKFSGANGALLWSREIHYGSGNGPKLKRTSITSAPSGFIYVAATVDEPLSYGPWAVAPTASVREVAVFRFAPDGDVYAPLHIVTGSTHDVVTFDIAATTTASIDRVYLAGTVRDVSSFVMTLEPDSAGTLEVRSTNQYFAGEATQIEAADIHPLGGLIVGGMTNMVIGAAGIASESDGFVTHIGSGGDIIATHLVGHEVAGTADNVVSVTAAPSGTIFACGGMHGIADDIGIPTRHRAYLAEYPVASEPILWVANNTGLPVDFSQSYCSSVSTNPLTNNAVVGGTTHGQIGWNGRTEEDNATFSGDASGTGNGFVYAF